jgi:hypothetical protein
MLSVSIAAEIVILQVAALRKVKSRVNRPAFFHSNSATKYFSIFCISYGAASVHGEQMESRAICCLIDPALRF